MTAKQAALIVPLPTLSSETRFNDGNTKDIITSIVEVDIESATREDLILLAQRLRGKTEFETCRNIWYFAKREFIYKADPNGHEQIRFPNRAIHDAAKGIGFDCKTFSTTIAELLRLNDIEGDFKFISQTWEKKATHIYCVAYLSDGRKVILDAVYHVFNQEPRLVHAWFKPIAKRKKAGAIGQLFKSSRENGLQYGRRL
jgi:hypothetical protein